MRTVCVGALVALVLCGTALGATGGAHVAIGAPHEKPSSPVPGKRFQIFFPVHAGAGRPLAVFGATVGGRAVAHADAYKGGVASTSLLVPGSAGGKSLVVKLTVESHGSTATRTARFPIHVAAVPSIAIEDASVTEGNVGTTALSFPVTLSKASVTSVSVTYTTNDGTALASSDYVAQSGKLVFAPGEVSKSITVAVRGDATIESNETLYVELSDPTGAKVVRPVATGTILNDDVAYPVTAGNYVGATQENNNVYFTVQPNRVVSGFRVNSITENCNANSYIQSGINWGDLTFALDNSGLFVAENNWTGSEVVGDVEYTAESYKVTGQFTSASTVSGSISISDDLNYQGTHYSCSGSVTYSATLQG